MFMHPTTSRLYQAFYDLMRIRGKSNVASHLLESPQTLNNWEQRGMSKAGMLKAQEILKIDINWLMHGTGEMFKEQQNVASTLVLNEKSVYKVPLVSWVKAGDFCENVDYMADDYEFVETTYKARQRTFALVVDGQSMMPKFPDGCTIIVEPDEIPVNGSYVVVRQNKNSEATFKQLAIDGSHKYLIALNPDWPNRIIEMLPDAVICGVVKKIQMDV